MANSGSTARQGVIAEAEASGIESGYWDIAGTWRETPESTLLELLQARRSARSRINGARINEEAAESLCLPAIVSPLGELPRLSVPKHRRDERAVFTPTTDSACIIAESGEEIAARLTRTSDHPQGGETCEAWIVEAETELGLGYHSIQINRPGARPIQAALIRTPAQCFFGAEDQKHLGISVQIYSLYSHQQRAPEKEQLTQRIGTFRDLREVSKLVLENGGNFVGINPLHPLSTTDVSPYSPMSRFALNDLYVDRSVACDYVGVSLQSVVHDEKSQQHGEEIAPELIDYEAQRAAQYLFISNLFERFQFSDTVNAERHREFEEFKETASDELRYFAVYLALQREFQRKDSSVEGWMQWPTEYQVPSSEAVATFVDQNKAEIDTVLFAQWLAHVQLSDCVSVFEQSKGIGLYTDMALGVNANSADAWMFRDSYVFEASIGAPPDGFNPNGQDWGLPPLDPDALRCIGYAPFISALRKAMQYAGAVRIDHVMSLFRLYWVLSNGTGGSYVRYPLEELFGIVALESQRNRCIVVGEDLGTVPDEVRDAMSRYRVLSYKVLIFMRAEDGGFCGPEAYPLDSLVTVSTHDLPTVSAYIHSSDIELRRSLGIIPDSAVAELSHERTEALKRLSELLEHYTETTLGSDNTTKGYVQATARYIAGTNSVLCALQLEDLAMMQTQVNVPGTTIEHANWRRPLSRPYEEILAEPWVRELLRLRSS